MKRNSTTKSPAPPVTAPTLLQRLFEPVDVASIALFRALFGFLMLWHVLEYIVEGWLETSYLAPVFRFKYPGFGWVERAEPGTIKLIFWVMAAAALLIGVGLAYRAACTVFFLGHSYVLLLDTAQYQNHLYLICLVAFLMIFIPAHRAFSLDALLRPKLRSDTVPAWCLWLLRIQLGIPYFYGGLAKINADWLLRAQPMRLWLREGTEGGLRLPFLREAWGAYAISWGGMLFDLLVIPALLWRRTRVPALVLAVLFHLTNSGLFEIGIFPWLMLAAVGLYLAPDWPRKAGLVGRKRRQEPGTAPAVSAVSAAWARRGIVTALLGVWLAVQLLVPFRHLLYPGNVDWTEEGHRFSWRMKLRDKRGDVRFMFVDPRSGESFLLSDLDAAVTQRQHRMMEHDPEMMRQLAVYLAGKLRQGGLGDVQIRVITSISFNGRRKQPLIDPEADLSRVSPDSRDWIEPLRP